MLPLIDEMKIKPNLEYYYDKSNLFFKKYLRISI